MSDIIRAQGSVLQTFSILPPADDYNRVVLDPEDNIPDSDYINASYVDVSTLPTV